MFATYSLVSGHIIYVIQSNASNLQFFDVDKMTFSVMHNHANAL